MMVLVREEEKKKCWVVTIAKMLCFNPNCRMLQVAGLGELTEASVISIVAILTGQNEG